MPFIPAAEMRVIQNNKGTKTRAFRMSGYKKNSWSLFFQRTTRQHLGIYGFDVRGHYGRNIDFAISHIYYMISSLGRAGFD